MNHVTENPLETRSKRPLLLTLLCICTFVGSSIFVIASFLGIISSSLISRRIEELAPEGAAISEKILLLTSFTILILFGLRLWGAIFMFYRKKSGFILYAIPSGLLLIITVVLAFATYHPIVIIYLVASLAFLVLYAMQLKNMK
ncbi:MAG: hypothetical protein WCQ95_10380 [Bacteroidota bacterium]